MLRKRIGAKEVFRAVCLATESALLLPWETGSLEVWWPRQWTTATSVGKLRASSNLAMRGPQEPPLLPKDGVGVSYEIGVLRVRVYSDLLSLRQV